MIDKTFGERIEQETYVDREGAYLICVRDGMLAVAETSKGYFLPGGGIEDGETHEACIKREVLEETGFFCVIGRYICSGDCYYFHDRLGYFHPIQHYYEGSLGKQISLPTEEDHTLAWVPLKDAYTKLNQLQAWAVERLLQSSSLVRLRDFRQSDIADYVRWFTVETEWGNWDAPWETEEESPETVERYWTRYYERHQNDAPDAMRYRFEIEDAQGAHIGWVSAYTIDAFLEYFDTKEEMLAIGIDIPEQALRHKGYGTEALRLFIEYLKKMGVKTVYTQTWSGNARMIRVAEKLGFLEYKRIVGVREVNGKKYDALTFQKELGREEP